MNCMDSFLRFVCSDRWKIDVLHELQCCQKEKCTLQSQRIGQNIALEYFSIFILPNLSRTEKKTMNIAQHSHFDRSCRSVHVTRACKQAPPAQLS